MRLDNHSGMISAEENADNHLVAKQEEMGEANSFGLKKYLCSYL
jgi:hypothetical protein